MVGTLQCQRWRDHSHSLHRYITTSRNGTTMNLLAFSRTGQNCAGCFNWAIVEFLRLNCHLVPERPERGGSCWQLKLRWMGTQRVQMEGVLPWFLRWSRRAGTRDFYLAFASLVNLVQNIFPQPYTISIYAQPCLDSRAGPPVSECVSPHGTQTKQFALSHILYTPPHYPCLLQLYMLWSLS
jgi:hypothetical protein